MTDFFELFNPSRISGLQRLESEKKLDFSDSPGVFFIFSKEYELLYIGCSINVVGGALWAHLDYKSDKKKIFWKVSKELKPFPYYANILILNKKHKSLAIDIKSRLVYLLKPKFNR